MGRALEGRGVQRTLSPKPMLRGSDIPRLLAIAGIAVLAACSDATAPATPKLSRPTLAAPLAAPVEVMDAIQVKVKRKTTDSVFAEFTVDKFGGWFVAGYHAVYFPPNAICDPATSGYGPALWDAP